MQKVVNVYYNGQEPLEKLNKYLDAGWVVVLMQSFSQNVSVSVCGQNSNKDRKEGNYGMTFVLQKNEDD